jgi:hypothetical protein
MGGYRMTDLQKERISSMRLAGESYSTIAEVLGMSRNTVKSYCQRNFCEKHHDESESCINRGKCEMCGSAIAQAAGYRKRRFCSDICRTAWWNAHRNLIAGNAKAEYTCAACGKRFTDYPGRQRKYCSHACYIAHRYGA